MGLKLCPECNGTGEEMADSASVYGIPGGEVAIGPCPNGCIAIEMWWCNLERVDSCMNECTPETPHDPSMLIVGGEPVTEACRFITRCLDPAHHIVMCKTHRSVMQQTICESSDLVSRRIGRNPFSGKNKCEPAVIEIIERGRPT